MTQNLFHPAISRSFSPKPFLARVQQRIGDRAPLVFYSPADYAVIFYARMFFPTFQTDPAKLKPPFYLLTRKRVWERIRGRDGLAMVDESEKEGDKKQTLVLIAVSEGARFQ